MKLLRSARGPPDSVIAVSRLVDVAAVTRSCAAEPVIEIAKAAPARPRTPYLTVGGRPAFEINFWCGTCPILFQRRSESGSYLPPGQMRDRLAHGLATLDPEVVTAFLSLLSAGDYLPMLLEIRPLLVHPGDPSIAYQLSGRLRSCNRPFRILRQQQTAATIRRASR